MEEQPNYAELYFTEIKNQLSDIALAIYKPVKHNPHLFPKIFGTKEVKVKNLTAFMTKIAASIPHTIWIIPDPVDVEHKANYLYNVNSLEYLMLTAEFVNDIVIGNVAENLHVFSELKKRFLFESFLMKNNILVVPLNLVIDINGATDLQPYHNWLETLQAFAKEFDIPVFHLYENKFFDSHDPEILGSRIFTQSL